jgi:phosphatidylglycerol---prolipoprotein diacylglyceryl transferase
VYPVLFHIGAVVIPSYGAAAALGVLAALLLAQRTARIVSVTPAHLWNLCVVALFAALIGARLLLVAANWRVLSRHPSWLLGLGMVHHPLVGAAAAMAGALAAWVYVRWQRLPPGDTADALAAPLAVGLAFEQIGALLAGSDYGTPAAVRWAVTYSSFLAARWSGTPLGVPVHPVQAYAAVADLTIALCLLLWLPVRRQTGDVAGLWLMMSGVAIYITEVWRDAQGRGEFFAGALDAPQVAAIAMVLAGGVVLRERPALAPKLRGAGANSDGERNDNAAGGAVNA